MVPERGAYLFCPPFTFASFTSFSCQAPRGESHLVLSIVKRKRTHLRFPLMHCTTYNPTNMVSAARESFQ
jgi:hypothetical protein